MPTHLTPAEEFRKQVTGAYGTILADPPWQFMNRTGKMAPEHRRLSGARLHAVSRGRASARPRRSL